MTETGQPSATPRGHRRRELLGALVWAFAVPVALTATQVGLSPSAQVVAWTYVVNLIITLGIGGSVWGLYALEERVGAHLPRRLPPWARHAVALPLGVLVGTEIALFVVSVALPFVSLDASRAMLWRIGAVASVVVVAVFGLVERWRDRADTLALAEAQARRDHLQAQLESVHARVQPHFLFNALNTVAALIDEDPELAISAVERLSALLRRSLDDAGQNLVPLDDELSLARDYVALERMRFEDRLDVRFDVDDAVLQEAVPRFCLQPLVENAVRHGMRAGRPLHVQVSARREGTRLVLTVEDDGAGSSNNPGTGSGRRDLRRRLQLHFGPDARLASGPRPEGGWLARIELPSDSD